jgi:small-conductance mechanosensitive channel
MLRNDDYLYELLRKIGLSRLGAQTGQYFVKIALILAIAMVASRVGGALARRFVNSLGTRSALYIESPRAAQRITTIGGVVASLVRIAVWVLAAIYVFDLLGFNLGPLLAGASIIGIALGFGAQTLVRDFLSGFFILVEDQYGVGDVVTVTEKVSGTIEEVNLRVTRLRGVDGTVWYVPNGEIRTVGNAAKDWARALVDIVLPYAADSATALSAIAEEAQAFAEDPAWTDIVLEPPEVWGVETVAADGVTVRVAAKTLPTRNHAVARALRGRIAERLRRDGIMVAVTTPTTP